MTPQTLIALVDGSAYSESVCHHAAWIAGRTGSSVTVYHVMGRRAASDTGDLSGAIKLGARTELLEQISDLDAKRAKLANDHGRAILEDARAIIEADGATRVETRLRQGDLVETVTATEQDGAMIVIGKRGEAAGLAAEQLGSNLERIVRASHKPVYVANRAFAAPSKILIAVDGGPSSFKAVDFVAHGPLFAGLPVSLVFVGSETAEVRELLDNSMAKLESGGFAPDCQIRAGEPEKVLSQMTDQEGYDLLVMGAYGHSRVRTLLIGSTTTQMIRSCRVPVLLMR